MDLNRRLGSRILRTAGILGFCLGLAVFVFGQETLDLYRAWIQGQVSVEILGAGMENIQGTVTRKADSEPLRLDVPVGTLFVSGSSGVQNMVTVALTRIDLTRSSSASFSVAVACANMHLAVPTAENSFSVQPAPMQQDLQAVLPLLNQAGAPSDVIQAAVWIITDNADYDDLGTLVDGFSGMRVINHSEAAQSMMYIQRAGIELSRKAIWRDRHEICRKVLSDGQQAGPEVASWCREIPEDSIARAAPTTQSTVFTVGPHGQFPTIQAAIDAAASGSTIEVAPGLYKGSVRLKSGLSLRGAGADRTVIESESAVMGKAVVLLEAVNQVELRGFTIRYTGQDSNLRVVQIERSESVILADNVIRDGAGFGVQVGCDGRLLVENNDITANGQTGLLVLGGPSGDVLTIRANRIVGNGTNSGQDLGDRAGMAIISCSAVVVGNSIDGSGGNGLLVYQAPSPRVEENTVVANGQGKDARYGAGMLIAESGGQFRRNHVLRNMTDGFVVLQNSTPEIEDNEVAENGQIGVAGRGHGIKLVDSVPHVGGNTIRDNRGFGIYVEGLSEGDPSSNTFLRNALGDVSPQAGSALGVVSPDAGSARGVSVVAEGLSFLYDVVIADQFLYWIETSAQMPGKDGEIPLGFIKRIPLAGGEVQTVLASEIKPGEPSTILTPTNLVVWGGHAYWPDPFAGTISGLPVASDSKRSVQVLDRGHFPFRVTVHGPLLVWGTFEDAGVVKRIPLEGGTSQTLASDVRGLWDLVARDDEVLWVETGEGVIKKTSVNGGPVSVVVRGLSRPQYLAVTDSQVYWSELGAGAGQGAIKRVSRTGGPPQVLVGGILHPGRFVVDSGMVFWNDVEAGTLSQVAVTGGDSTILASGLKTPQGLAVDEQYVYWSEETGGVIKKIRR